MTTMGQKKKQLPQTAPAFSHAVIVYPYGTRRVTTLRDNEYIGIRPAELNRIRLEPAANLERYVILAPVSRSEEHTSELQSLMRISYAVFCLKNKKQIQT